MAQYAVPVATLATGAWSECSGDGDGDLHDEWDTGIDSGGGPDTSTVWSSQTSPIDDKARVRLGALTDPESSSGHILKVHDVRMRNCSPNSSGTWVGSLQVDLYDAAGTTLIASFTVNPIPSSWATHTYTLTGTEADNIPSADYATGLIVEVTADSVSGTGREAGIAEIEFEVPDAPASGIEGTLTATLANITLAGAGEVDVDGTLNQTLANVALDGAGEVNVEGALTVTLADVTLDGSGSALGEIQGSLSQTLSAVILDGAGTVEVEGTATPTLADFTLSGAGSVDVVGTLAGTLAAVVLAGAGGVLVSGALGRTLDAVTLVAAGVETLPVGIVDVSVSASVPGGSTTAAQPGGSTSGSRPGGTSSGSGPE